MWFGTLVGVSIMMTVCGFGIWMVLNVQKNELEASSTGDIDVLDLAEIARDTFKVPADADAWMREKHPLLDGLSPLKAAQTKAGAKRVNEILTAIKWGGVV